jgi:quercetin dioxygenase-like cupin family protein
LRMKTKVLALFSTGLGVLVLGAGVAMATVSVGFSASIIAKGTIAKPVEVSVKGIEFSTKGPTDVINQRVTFDPAGNSGWHMHPGLVFVTVIEGSVATASGCQSPVVYGVGQSFVEPPMEAGYVKNTSTTVRAVTFATLVVPHGVAPRIDAPAPVCRTREKNRDDEPDDQ